MNAERPENSQEDMVEPEKLPEGATDLELALFLATHMDTPCGAEVSEGVREDIRDFYVREAKNALTTMEDGEARDILEDKIKEYEE